MNGSSTMGPCTACGSDASKAVFEGASLPRQPLRRCARCDTVFLPARKDGFVSELYEYYAQYLGKPRSELYDQVTEKRLIDLSEQLKSAAPGRKLLDVGCGHGQWVALTNATGWDARGIELSKSAVQLCKQFDLPVMEIDFFSSELTRRSYDLITMFELIEHVPSPATFLRRAAELLSDHGILFMSTPNFGSLDRRLLGGAWPVIHEEHLSYFTPSSMKRLVSSTGLFDSVEITTRNFSPEAVRIAALGKLRRRMRRTRSEAATAPSLTPLNRQSSLRKRIEESRVLSTAKAGTNAVLNALGLGCAMYIQCRRA